MPIIHYLTLLGAWHYKPRVCWLSIGKPRFSKSSPRSRCVLILTSSPANPITSDSSTAGVKSYQSVTKTGRVSTVSKRDRLLSENFKIIREITKSTFCDLSRSIGYLKALNLFSYQITFEFAFNNTCDNILRVESKLFSWPQ